MAAKDIPSSTLSRVIQSLGTQLKMHVLPDLPEP